MTAADKRETIAAIRQVARWMSDPRHRVKDWFHAYEDAEGAPTNTVDARRTCISGAFAKVANTKFPLAVRGVGLAMKGNDAFFKPWTTAELRKLFAESIKAVEAA